ncbi:MAG: nucleotidyltransferase domain-containing protein [Nitrososphaerota archaeon]
MKSQKLLEARERILEVLRDAAEELEATAYLFGNYARRDHMLDSDIDVVIVSRKFENMKFIDRVELVRKMLPQDLGFDIIPLTPQELERKLNNSFYKGISRYWIEIRPDRT